MQIVYGIHPVIEALKSNPGEISKVIIAKGKKSDGIRKILDLAALKNVSVDFEDRNSMGKLVNGRPDQGVVCLCNEYRYVQLEEMLLDSTNTARGKFILILDSIVDPHNLGSLIRTGHCFGIDGIVIPENRAASVTPAVIKVSAGAAHHIKIAKVVNISRSIDYLKENGFWIYGADAYCGEDLCSLDYSGHIGLVMGNEETGIRPLVKKKCDFLVSISMAGNIDSLNVSVAGGIMLHEMTRNRIGVRMKEGGV
jgi:23S rRNA (guanosine2251-2'-O)-methyltransferase